MTPSEPEQPAVSQPDANNIDVIVVGASLAGCTAARLYAQQGLRVAVVEQQREAGAFKHLCTHFIQASATPVLKAIGLDELIEQARGVRNSVDVWTRYGWAGEVPPEDAPDLKRARPLGRPILVKDYPSEWRPAIVQGTALIGDAQMSLDPLWGVGCGFAFQTARWLVDCTASSLHSGAPLAPRLERYARTVARRLGGHRFLLVDFAKRRRFNAIERLMFSAAARDRQMARHLYAFGARLSSPMQFLSPQALLRATWVNLRHSDARDASLNVPS
jgi:flavin-dependent dehydrogenase